MTQLAREGCPLATIRYMPDQGLGPARALYERMMRESALRGWTNTELSKQVGVSRSTIDKLATQPRPPQSATVLRIAAKLGIPSAEALALAGILPEEAPGAVIPKMALSAEGHVNAPDDSSVRLPLLVVQNWDNPNVRVIWGLDAPEDGRLRLVRELLGLGRGEQRGVGG